MNTLSLIKNLDKKIADYLVAQNVAQDSKNWVDTLNKNPNSNEKHSHISSLFYAVVNTPGWRRNPLLFNVANSAREHLKMNKEDLPKTAKKTYNQAKTTFRDALITMKKDEKRKAKSDKKAQKAFQKAQNNEAPK